MCLLSLNLPFEDQRVRSRMNTGQQNTLAILQNQMHLFVTFKIQYSLILTNAAQKYHFR